jgi:hypothetical protein
MISCLSRPHQLPDYVCIFLCSFFWRLLTLRSIRVVDRNTLLCVLFALPVELILKEQDLNVYLHTVTIQAVYNP